MIGILKEWGWCQQREYQCDNYAKYCDYDFWSGL